MKKIRYDRLIILAIILIIIILVLFFLIKGLLKKEVQENKMIDLRSYSKDKIEEYANENKLKLTIEEQDSSVPVGEVVSQSIKPDETIKENDELKIIISKGIDYEKLKVNEVGSVPIMMYHGIHEVKDNKYTGGNIDYDGYQRTAKAFREDLEFYYKEGYRMIRLEDYVNGIIDVPAGYSPIILTFDDGLENNISVTGLDKDGNIIIDPNSAVSILNEFKEKYPDYNVTATFFITDNIFEQPKYDEKILHYLVDNGYDVGNHTYSHVDFTGASIAETQEEVGSVYETLEKYIPNQYVNIVALPYGSPYDKEHKTFPYILDGEYNGKKYHTISTLRVGWEAEFSPFDSDFDKTFLKRIRAYDNNGEEFDIEMNFDILKRTRYISDGNKNTVVVPKDKEEYLGKTDLKVITY